MREIKFRAWGVSEKKMFLADSIARIHFDKGLPYAIMTWDEDIILRNDMVLQQYIGLKDKNGKEMCEGDIVESTLNEMKIGTVIFDKGRFYLNFGKISLTFMYENMHKLKIIGNLYENPGLLKEPK